GERLTSDSAVRCVGNTLLLNGSVYAPPYLISAIGSPSALTAALASDPLVQRLQIYVDDFHLGFAVSKRSSLTAPPFRGVVSAVAARPTT
ncbi:MAG TPA: DUF881 domain-containing protein, partial [Actinomycetota bacterium]|nr:DUF881 domain-containing protein [Actinomycetota bacterium]